MSHCKALFAFFLGVFLCGLVYLEGATIAGTVTDTEYKGLEAVLLRSGKHKSLSGKEGSFSIELMDSLHISRLGYKSQVLSQTQVQQLYRPNQKLIITMESEPVQLPTYRVFSHFEDAAISAVKLVIDPDRNYSNTSELISQSAAMQSSGTNLKGEIANLGILGNVARHTLVMVDGVAVNPQGEPFDFSRLDIANIESIEIIKNNASVYGGASAIGGLVKICTKQGRGADKEFESKTETGSYGFIMQQLTASGGGQNSSYRFSVSGFSAKNDFEIKQMDMVPQDGDAIRKNNTKQQVGFSGVLGMRIAPLNISVSTDYTAFSRELPGPLNFIDLYREAKLSGYSLRPQMRIAAKYGKIDWQSNWWLHIDNTTYDNTRGELSIARAKYTQKLLFYGMRQSITYSQNDLLAGFSAESSANNYRYQNKLNPSQPGINKTTPQYNATANVQYQLKPGFFMLSNSVAVRYDHLNSDAHLSARYEGSIRNWGDKFLEIGGTIGNSYAVPSPYDLYWKGDLQAMGNPDLNSENSLGYQIWLQGSVPGMQIKATLHRNQIENLIVWRQVQMNGIAWKPVNVGKAEIRNLELEGHLAPIKQLQVNASVLFTQARDTSNLSFGKAPSLMYRPDLLYTLSAAYQKGFANIWGKVSHAGKQWTTPDNLIDPIAAYTLFDCGASLKLNWHKWHFTPSLTIKNLLDTAYMVHAYVPEPGRSFYAGLKLGR